MATKKIKPATTTSSTKSVGKSAARARGKIKLEQEVDPDKQVAVHNDLTPFIDGKIVLEVDAKKIPGLIAALENCVAQLRQVEGDVALICDGRRFTRLQVTPAGTTFTTMEDLLSDPAMTQQAMSGKIPGCIIPASIYV